MNTLNPPRILISLLLFICVQACQSSDDNKQTNEVAQTAATTLSNQSTSNTQQPSSNPSQIGNTTPLLTRKPVTASMMEGSWISDDDPDQQLYISGMRYTEYNNGKLKNSGTCYILNGNDSPCSSANGIKYTSLVIQLKSQRKTYCLLQADGIDLKMQEIEKKGGLLSFHKN